LVLETAASIVNYFDARFVSLLEKDILWLKIAVNDVILSMIFESLQDLYCKPANKAEGNSLKIIVLDKLIEIDAEELKRDYQMLPEN
jgi:hypothetical protein